MQNDQGEARNIIIRGMGPELNSVTFNGERVPSAEGDNRRIQLDLIPSDMIQTIEVNKTLTPEMDADAIGGSVNLVSRAPSNGLRLSGTLAGGYNPIRDGFIGTGNFIIGNRSKNQKVGYLINGSINSNDFGSDNVEAVWSKSAAGKVFVSDHDIRTYDVKRVRRSLSASFDFKLAPSSTISVVGSYNWRDDLENREFKERELGEEWDGLTPRKILQLLGTEAGRDIIHPNIWVNSLFADYTTDSNWIITDVRFPNEAKAIKDRGGIVVRIERPGGESHCGGAHASETALDDYDFDIVINNDGTIEELIDKVKQLNLV